MNSAAYYIGVVVGALAVGAILGIAPLIVGLKKDKKGLAIGGFVACIVAGFVAGILLALPVCIGFVVAIILVSKKNNAVVENAPVAATEVLESSDENM